MDVLRADWSPAGLSRIAFGCGLLGGDDWGVVDEADALDAVRTAVDAGITVFDTADVYGLGRSETRLARALGARIHEVTIVTKGGVAWGEPDAQGRAVTRKDLSPEHLRSALQGSLRRLGLERIPVYLAHWPDGVHSLSETVAVLKAFQQEGLVGRIGVSNFGAREITEAGILSQIDLLEVEHSLLRPDHQTLEVARSAGLPVLTYGTLAQGFLTAKYQTKHLFGPSDQRHRLAQFVDPDEAHQALLLELQSVADELGLTAGQVAIRWALTTAPHASAIVGARNPLQALENVRAAGSLLDDQLVQRLNAAVPAS